jgi:hypothetical protein
MNVEIETVATKFLFWEHLFSIFSICPLQCVPARIPVVFSLRFCVLTFICTSVEHHCSASKALQVIFACAVDFAFKRAFNLMTISTFVLYCFCSKCNLVVPGT